MLITNKLSLDLMEANTPERIQVKQGDTLSRCLEIQLFSGGEAWDIPAEVTPLVRWSACDPDTGETASGIYDTLPSGSVAWNYAENQLDLMLVPQMFALPGLVQADVAMVQGEKTLATFNFEFYVNHAPANGTEAQAQSWYKVASLEQINAAITALQEWQAVMDEQFANLEHEVFELKKIVYEM